MRQAGNVIIAKEYDFTNKIELTPSEDFADIQTGMVNIYTDIDGTSRSIPTKLRGEPSLAQITVTKYLGKAPTAPDKLLVNFAGEPNTFKTISAVDVGKENFDDKIVLIGATAPDLHDDYIVPTSHGKRMPGIEIHAHAIQTLLTKQYLKHQTFTTLAIIIIIFSLITGILFSRFPIRYSAPILAAILVAYMIATIFAFKKRNNTQLSLPTNHNLIDITNNNKLLSRKRSQTQKIHPKSVREICF